jgi:hypothetical protein
LATQTLLIANVNECIIAKSLTEAHHSPQSARVR